MVRLKRSKKSHIQKLRCQKMESNFESKARSLDARVNQRSEGVTSQHHCSKLTDVIITVNPAAALDHSSWLGLSCSQRGLLVCTNFISPPFGRRKIILIPLITAHAVSLLFHTGLFQGFCAFPPCVCVLVFHAGRLAPGTHQTPSIGWQLDTEPGIFEDER